MQVMFSRIFEPCNLSTGETHFQVFKNKCEHFTIITVSSQNIIFVQLFSITGLEHQY